ncbi:hypothetical protein IU501_10995 [Nocardia otitidiscaviarum]|uniref:hypothetical protein n=1 Tax=Nocardia otitidiscaviarum TaxID=1823 RepID=UPI001894D938|nr:hypothetical protein [Nocardia otitidiscaviarum]MBF6133526.1 hypothetical protein [Nocardia otitidiscaviarum]
MKRVGEEAGISRPGEPSVVAWTVTDIGVDEPCTSIIAVPAERGHFITLDVEAWTGPQFEPGALPGNWQANNDWSFVDADGITVPRPYSTASSYCHEIDDPRDIAPASKYRFRLTFDVPTPSGILVFRPHGDGWEYPIP